MGRRRKSQDAASGFLLLLAIAVVVAIFVIRLAITVLFYSTVPLLIITCVATFWRTRAIRFRDPEEFDDDSTWRRITGLRSERRALFADMREKYAVGFRNGLVVTAKSDSRLFHAGSRLGKKLNQELEELYFAADSISDEIRLLRTGVLSNISDWRAPFVTFAQSHKIFSASSITLLVLVILSIGLHHIFVLPLEIRDQALRVLLWNPDPLNIGGDLVISCGAALIAGLFIWPFAGSHALRSDDLSTYRRWEALEEKWSQAMEYEEFIVEDDDSRIHYQNTQSQAQDPNLQWFQILNVHEHAPPDDIKQAYRDAIRQYHPDKVSGLGEKLRKVAEEESQKINAAFSEAKRRRGFV